MPVSSMDSGPKAPPVIDFAPFFGDDQTRKQKLVNEVRDACLEKGFFQIVNHGVPVDLQQAIFEQSKHFFSLATEEKMRFDKSVNPNRLGYESLRSQNFEKKTSGDLKEGFFIGRELPADHPYVKANKLQCGQNVYPDNIPDTASFRVVVNSYHAALTGLAENILRILAQTLGLDAEWFSPFCKESAAVLRLLHYPPQAPDASADERGIGAHTDFGGVTILLQDDVGGLQVLDAPTSTWVDVQPTPGAFVVNLGNLIMRWSNDTYISNVHRVINKSGKERFSIPFFYSGNPDMVVDCIPGCADPIEGPKYGPVKVEDWILGRQINTAGGKGVEEMSALAVKA